MPCVLSVMCVFICYKYIALPFFICECVEKKNHKIYHHQHRSLVISLAVIHRMPLKFQFNIIFSGKQSLEIFSMTYLNGLWHAFTCLLKFLLYLLYNKYIFKSCKSCIVSIYDPTKYRAIAVASNLCKLFARILLHRLIRFREKINPDTPNQQTTS